MFKTLKLSILLTSQLFIATQVWGFTVDDVPKLLDAWPANQDGKEAMRYAHAIAFNEDHPPPPEMVKKFLDAKWQGVESVLEYFKNRPDNLSVDIQRKFISICHAIDATYGLGSAGYQSTGAGLLETIAFDRSEDVHFRKLAIEGLIQFPPKLLGTSNDPLYYKTLKKSLVAYHRESIPDVKAKLTDLLNSINPKFKNGAFGIPFLSIFELLNLCITKSN